MLAFAGNISAATTILVVLRIFIDANKALRNCSADLAVLGSHHRRLKQKLCEAAITPLTRQVIMARKAQVTNIAPNNNLWAAIRQSIRGTTSLSNKWCGMSPATRDHKTYGSRLHKRRDRLFIFVMVIRQFSKEFEATRAR